MGKVWGALFSVYSGGAYNRGAGRFFQKLCLKVLDKKNIMAYNKGMLSEKQASTIKSIYRK